MTDRELISASQDEQATSVARMFYDRVAATPDAEAYRFPRFETWESVTWAQTGAVVRDLAAGLLSLGVQHEDRVAIASSTRIEWIYADLAIACAGGATTTIYPTANPEDVGLILADSASKVAFAEDDAQVARLRALRPQLPALEVVVTFDGETDGDWVLSLDDLRALGPGIWPTTPTPWTRPSPRSARRTWPP